MCYFSGYGHFCDHGGGSPLGQTDLTYSMATYAGMYIGITSWAFLTLGLTLST